MRSSTQEAPTYCLTLPQARVNFYADGNTGFTIIGRRNVEREDLLRMDTYSAAMAFVDGEITVAGDLYAAIRFFTARHSSGFRGWLYAVAARLSRSEIQPLLENRRRAARNIQFHYDLSNEFYRQFLDSRMQYSEGHFATSECSLEEAQVAKLERICHRLGLQPGHSLLDVGCGWGGLLAHAGEHFGIEGMGCTLSWRQFEFANATLRELGLDGRVSVRLMDYRDVTGCFDRIASVGMFEHVGRSRLRGYFDKVYSLLAPGGLFLNRGIVRPEAVSDGPETLFLQRQVFPGGELLCLSDVIGEAERAGFETVSLESVQGHYARTCRAWVSRLQGNRLICERLVGPRAYRTWLLYLAGSAVSFEDGSTGAIELVFAKRKKG